MATYLQGVTDYIPEFQPFQPDLNFYANIMQTKQSQYDSNWNALNKMYGQYFYADLTRDNNIKKKDELIKNIDFNLKRISQLDLSLEQNVNQATQVFKPFYEDKNLMKDMAWTKNYNSQVGKAEAFRGSADKERSQQFWDTGLRELQYKKDEFKNATDAEAMSFGNVAYTPYVNSVELAQKLAKESGLSIETVDFSPDGRWIITQKNGEKLREPLSKLFEATLGNDPKVQAVYKTQAYVNRKDYAYSNAAQFNGDKNAAEMKYLEDSFNILKEQNAQRYKDVQDRTNVYDTKIKELEKSIANKTAAPGSEKTLNEYKKAKEINDKILERVQKQNDEFNKNSSSTPSTTTGFVNPYGDINSLRWKVDNGMSSMLMSKDLNEAAEIFAYRDAKTSIKENPYKVLEVKHAQAMQQIHTRGSYSTRAAAIRAQGARDAANIRNKGEAQNLKMKDAIDKGYAVTQPVIDPRTGQVALDEYGQPIIKVVANPNEFYASGVKGGAKGESNPFDLIKNMLAQKDKSFEGAGNQMAIYLKNLRAQNLISDDEIDAILNPGDRFRGGAPDKYTQSLERVLEGEPTKGPMGRPDDYIDFDPQLRSQRTQRVTLENLSSLKASDIYNLEKTFIPIGTNLTGANKEGTYVDNRNYYASVISGLEGYIKDNYDIDYIRETGDKFIETMRPVKLEAMVTHDIEEWKYNTRLAIEEQIAYPEGTPKNAPAAPVSMLFNENNELLSKEAVFDALAKSVYGQEVEAKPKQSFFGAVSDSYLSLLGFVEDTSPETKKYWNNFFSDKQPPSTWLGEKLSTMPLGPAGMLEKLIMGDKYIDPRAGDKDFIYVNMKNKLEEIYDKTFKTLTDSDWYVKNNLGNMPSFSILNEGGTGFAAMGTSIEVLPKAPGSKGHNSWMGFIRDFNNIPSFDGKVNAIMFGDTKGLSGTERTALDDEDLALQQTRKSEPILRALINASKDPNNKLIPFTITAQNIAGDDYNKGAITIRPDAEFLKQFKSTGKDEDDNLLNTEEYNAILQNGFSVVSDIANFTNPLMATTYKSPLESIVDYRGSYEEAIPGGGVFRIDKGTGTGVSDYITSTTLDTYDPSTGNMYKDIVYDSYTPKKGALELQLSNQLDILKMQREDNIRAFNGYYNNSNY